MVVTMKTTGNHGRLSIECPRARIMDTLSKVCRGQPWRLSLGSNVVRRKSGWWRRSARPRLDQHGAAHG
jgi:hypothetical protein